MRVLRSKLHMPKWAVNLADCQCQLTNSNPENSGISQIRFDIILAIPII